MDLKIYPEWKVWNFLEELGIPWQKKLKELSPDRQLKEQNYAHFIPVPLTQDVLGETGIEVRAEVGVFPQWNQPATVWRIEKVYQPDLDPAFQNLSDQLLKKLGPGKPEQAVNVKGFNWQFGNATVSLAYYFEKSDHQGKPAVPSLSITVGTDYRNFTTEVEESILDNSASIYHPPDKSVDLLPQDRTPQYILDQFSFRLANQLGPLPPTVGYNAQKNVLTFTQGFVAFLVPVDRLSRLILFTSAQRMYTEYFLKAVLKSRSGSSSVGSEVILARLPGVREALQMAKLVSQATRLELTSEIEGSY
jgi:hypothetical protein